MESTKSPVARLHTSRVVVTAAPSTNGTAGASGRDPAGRRLPAAVGTPTRSAADGSDVDPPPRFSRPAEGVDAKSAGWLLLLPVVCCGGPLLIVAAASAGAIGWGALGAGVAIVVAAAVLLVARRRAAASRCCDPLPAARQKACGPDSGRVPAPGDENRLVNPRGNPSRISQTRSSTGTPHIR